jgi:hypothetical protein
MARVVTYVDAPPMTDDTDLPTPRTTLAARYVRVLLTCWHCRHQADADLQGLIDGAVAMSRWCACGGGARGARATASTGW